MAVSLNLEDPNIMHIDLNSCFATVEQQAHPSLRGRPMGVTNRLTSHATVIACSYEAKGMGVRVGTSYQEAKQLAPGFVMVETDPPKYHYVYQKLASIMKSYSPKIKMKSIDEGIIDFHGTRQHINNRSLEAIGFEIKQRLQTEVGSWMRCNIGIAPNHFLAKLAAGLHKPDGMDIIDHRNLRSIYRSLQLTDLPGIADHYAARLNANAIFTPLQFLEARPEVLHRQVFKSIVGQQWHSRLRGYEVDDVTTNMGMVGRQFVLDGQTHDEQKLLSRLHYLCQTTGMKLRYNNVDARGVAVWARYASGETFFVRKMHKTVFYTDQAIYERIMYLFNQRAKHMDVSAIGLYCYGLAPTNRQQLGLLDDVTMAEDLTQAMDEVNERFGNFTLTYANALEGKRVVKQKIPFGGTRYFSLLVSSAEG